MMTAQDIARRTGDLPPMPQVAAEVMRMVGDEKTNARDLERVISRDQALAARVLKIANSAAYGAITRIETIRQAVTTLGMKTLNALTIASATGPMMTASKSSFKDKILWEHSLAVGLVAKIVSSKTRKGDPDVAFIAGLLHDIGKIALDKSLPEQYEPIVMRVFNENVTFMEAEREALGFDHCEVGSLVAGKWNLPDAVRDVIRFHHDPASAIVDRNLTAVIGFANAVCVQACIGPERNPALDVAGHASTRFLELDDARVEEFTLFAHEELGNEIGAFSSS